MHFQPLRRANGGARRQSNHVGSFAWPTLDTSALPGDGGVV